MSPAGPTLRAVDPALVACALLAGAGVGSLEAAAGAGTVQTITGSVVGSPVLRSPSVFEAWLAARGLTYEEVRPRRQGWMDGPKAQMRLDLFAV